MYESYFKLREKPFDIVPNPAYLYLSKTHKQAMTYFNFGLQERFGFVLMTGEVGSGKTTLIRELIRTMGPEINLARVFNTRVSSQELIAMINEDFGLDTAGKGKVLMLKDLYEHLIKEYEQGRRSVVIIDEAQNLSLDLLEEVRMLSNLETNEATLLQIMLVGQPQLGRILSLAEMRQFRQRISIVCHILPLTRQETEDYILHRLAVAGNRDALSFHDGAFDAIHEISDGIPRKINMLCNFLLLTAFTEERRDVPVEMVRDVAGGLGLQKNAELDSNAAYPSAMRQTPGNDDRINKGALLRALGLESPVSGNHTRTASGADSAGDANEYPAAIRSIGLRLHALEKGMEHVGKKDHAEPAKRAEAPETRDAGSPARQRTDRQNIATDHPAQDAGSPAGQRTVRQDIVTDHPGQPYCDLPSGKRPR
jgi:putative secretion ATPase (PEP-CTERM system associated)